VTLPTTKQPTRVPSIPRSIPIWPWTGMKTPHSTEGHVHRRLPLRQARRGGLWTWGPSMISTNLNLSTRINVKVFTIIPLAFFYEIPFYYMYASMEMSVWRGEEIWKRFLQYNEEPEELIRHAALINTQLGDDSAIDRAMGSVPCEWRIWNDVVALSGRKRRHIHCLSPSCASAPPFALVFTPVPHWVCAHSMESSWGHLSQ
jgi:hypothetical protein